MSLHATHEQVLAWVANGASIGVVMSALIGWLPPIAAIIAILWYLINIYESDTIRKWLLKRAKARLDKLKAKTALLESKLTDVEKDE